MKLYCVIPTLNNSAGLAATLKSLYGQTRRPDGVIVVDNASGDDTERVVRGFPGVEYLHLPDNSGSAGGYYEGLKSAAAKADLLFLSDDDATFKPDVLEKLESSLLQLSSSFPVGAVRCAWDTFRGEKPEMIADAAWSGTLIKSEVVGKIGLPLRELFLYSEDVEYFSRMRKAGFPIYVVPGADYLSRSEGHKKTVGLPFRPAVIYKDDFRLYYAFRNEIYVDRLHGLGRRTRILLYFLKIVLFLRPAAVLACLDGLKDGFMGVLGKNARYRVVR